MIWDKKERGFLELFATDSFAIDKWKDNKFVSLVSFEGGGGEFGQTKCRSLWGKI